MSTTTRPTTSSGTEAPGAEAESRRVRRGEAGTRSAAVAPHGADSAPEPATRSDDPRVQWSASPATETPVLRHRRDGILPTTAAALSVRGTTLTCTASRGEQPPAHHPLIQDFLDALATERRHRFTGRCPEAVLLSRHLSTVDSSRSKRAARKPLTTGEARRAFRHAKITTRHIREDGDPAHGTYATPCTSCDALLAHFNVTPVAPAAPDAATPD
ncbi:YwqJ-related putative deaminase [Streptomyces sp. NPDC059740]|uniref:YwqJ-related putative deaminase n=1 Tax=Streptomyces sp. NPDC059740 TaxID=3346926 RepID=UPI00365C13A7